MWNGYDGRIYISSAFHLADRAFQPARVLVQKSTEEQKNWSASSFSLSPALFRQLWQLTHNNCSQSQYKYLRYLTRYPTLIPETLGDRRGENHLHLYWRDFHKGLGAGQSIFRCLFLRLPVLFSIIVSLRKATLEIKLNDTFASSPSTPISSTTPVPPSTSISTSTIPTTTSTALSSSILQDDEMDPWQRIYFAI